MSTAVTDTTTKTGQQQLKTYLAWFSASRIARFITAATSPATTESAIEKMMAAEPVIQEAERFRDEFVPLPETDYTWVMKRASENFSAKMADYKRLDDKAASVVGWVGAATGATAVGAAFAVAKGELSVWLALSLMPAIIFAIASIKLAVEARRSNQVPFPNDAKSLTEYVAGFGKSAEAATLGEWHVCEMRMGGLLTRRSLLVDRALRLALRATALLALPLFVAVGMKLITPNKPSATLDRIVAVSD